MLTEPDAPESDIEQHVVTVGRSLGDDREVTAGLDGGDEVVLDPPQDLVDGARVRIAGTDLGDSE